MSPDDPTVVIANTVALNGGDAAILVAEADLLQKMTNSHARLVVFDANPAAARRHYPEYDFRLRLQSNGAQPLVSVPGLRRVSRAANRARYALGVRLWLGRMSSVAAKLVLTPREIRDLGVYAGADLIAYTGGTYLVEQYNLEPVLFDMELAARLGRPYVLLPQSIGEITDPVIARRLADCLTGAEAIVVRDHASRSHVQRLIGDRKELHVLPDVVFAMDRPSEVSGDQAARPSPSVGNPLAVAVSVRDWHHFQTSDSASGMGRYLRAVTELVVHLVLRHGARVTLVSTCQGIPEYWADDSLTATTVHDMLPAEVRRFVQVDTSFHSPRNTVKLLSRYDVVVATRMHMAIMALVAGTPVVTIAYAFKTREMFRSLGWEEWMCDIETVGGSELIRLVDGLLKDLPGARRRTTAAASSVREQASTLAGLLREKTSLGVLW